MLLFIFEEPTFARPAGTGPAIQVVAVAALSLATKTQDIHKHPIDLCQAILDSSVVRSRERGCLWMVKAFAELHGGHTVRPKLSSGVLALCDACAELRWLDLASSSHGLAPIRVRSAGAHNTSDAHRRDQAAVRRHS